MNGLDSLFSVRGHDNRKGWSCKGPSCYFTKPTHERFEAESHSAVTASMNLMRCVEIPEIPTAPMHIKKERLEGFSHARHCHSTAGQSQEVLLNCLWLLHGNRCPILADPGDGGQASYKNKIGRLVKKCQL